MDTEDIRWEIRQAILAERARIVENLKENYETMAKEIDSAEQRKALYIATKLVAEAVDGFTLTDFLP
jgi:hypothetical protein